MKNLITFILLILTLNCFSQEKNSDLILLADAFHKYHAWSIDDNSIFDRINNIKAKDLQDEKEFIGELIKSNNDILNPKYLAKPDSSTLKNIFIIRGINYNLYSENPKDNNLVIEELKNKDISHSELLACYYDLIFSILVNKHDDLDMSTIDFQFSKLKLFTKEEKEIFFLSSLKSIVYDVWLDKELSDNIDYNETRKEFLRFPKYNGLPYYQFQELGFSGFQIELLNIKELKKGYDSLLNVLNCHSILLKNQKESLKK